MPARSRSWFRFCVLALFALSAVSSWSPAPRAVQFSDWAAPVNLGAIVNSTFQDFAPELSKNGLSLYFASDRPGYGSEDLWVAQRTGTDAPWGAPVNLGPVVNSAALERSPALSRDGHWLFFASTRPARPGEATNVDLWASWRAHTHDDFAWEPPVNVAALNTAATDLGPEFLAENAAGNPELYFVSNRPGGSGALDIWVSELVDGFFQAPWNVTPLNSSVNDLTPALRHDGHEILIASTRAGTLGGQDLWVSTRASVGDPWSTPVNLGPIVNSTSNENFPTFSNDRKSLYFNSDRPGGYGGSDLYLTTRTK
jgi:Tol biopolymer transport system component